MGKALYLVSCLLLFLFLAGCSPKAAKTPAPQSPAPVTAPIAVPAPAAAPAAPTKPAWQVKWDQALEAAKRESVVAFATSTGSTVRRDMSETFRNKYGIRVESIMGISGQLVSKVLAERKAGLYLWDVLIVGSPSQINAFKPGRGTSPLEPALILPDLTDPEVIKQVWYDGKLPWIDKERHVLGGLLYVSASLGINTSLVKAGEIKSWDDLLNSKWKGKILILDPTQAGTNMDGGVMPMFYDFKGESWVRRLAAQEPGIIGDDRLGQEWLAHGRYPIFIPPRTGTFADFIRAGAPVAYVWTQDVSLLTSGPSGVALVDKAPHPNAAKVFINWFLSKEGQTILSQATLSQSGRLDVPTDFLLPEQIRQPGGKYWIRDREEVFAKIDEYRAKSKEIFGPLLK